MAASNRINNRYEIRSTIGRGGMGVVYRAYDYVTKRDVAIKTMLDMADAVALDLFMKEWTVLAGLSHPNIVDILDTGEYEEGGRRRPYFVMPMLPGNTLDSLIKNASHRLTVNRVVEILVQTCRGLQAAHERGLVHRDLKPSNIFVLEDDTAKIIDFGVVHLTGSHSVTGIKGTLQYMAPEQLELQPATALSDIFSLGVVGYETLTARKPFARQTEGDTAEAVRKFVPPPASEVNPSVSDLISRVIHKAMAKQPRHRFASAREFAETLTKALHNQNIDSFDPAKIRPRIERARKAFDEGDLQFAGEILGELEAEGHIDPDMSVLRMQIDQATRKKTIRQLIESARTRFEQEEYPLALQKLQEVLRLEPDNGDALALKKDIESHRSERQVENWFRLVKEHLERNAFSEARQGLDEILKINPKESRALQLRTEVEQKEQDAVRVRNEKEQLYNAARAAFQNGEISTALSRLERVLKLNVDVPGGVVPERDSLYQSLYNQVRTEHDSIRMAYDEGRRELTEQNFGRAVEICDQYLNKYPGHPLFQALKLEAGELQRQQLSALLAETGKRVDAEPDLDRKIAILKEAAEKNPGERQFQDALKLTRERRDLVNSIVAKARQYEERAQFAEAIGQWEILRNIYSAYPGIAFEIDQLQKRRENQAQEESKARWTEQIDRAIDAAKFDRALDLVGKALEEFPSDAELTNLGALARKGLERSAEANRLFEEGQKLVAEGRFEEGTAQLRQAVELDERNPVIAQALANALVEEARELVEADWRPAESLVEQALMYDPSSAAAKSLRALVQDRKRREFVAEAVARARQLQVDGKIDEALEEMDRALVEAPGEQRLVQLQNTLRNSLVSGSRVQTRNYYLKQLRDLMAKVATTFDGQELRMAADQARNIAAKFPEDTEIRTMAAEVAQVAMNQQTVIARSPIVPSEAAPTVAADQAAARAAAGAQIPPPLTSSVEAAETSAMNLSAGAGLMEDSETTVLPAGTPPSSPSAPGAKTPTPKPAQAEPPAKEATPERPTTPPPAPPLPPPPPKQTRPHPAAQPKPPSAPGGGVPMFVWLAIGLVALLAIGGGGVWYMLHRPGPGPTPQTTAYPIAIQSSQSGALIQIDGQTVQPGVVQLSAGNHTATALLDGYQPISQQFTVAPNAPPLRFDFEPAPQHVRVVTGIDAGKAVLDNGTAVDLQDGSFFDDNVTAAQHKLNISGRTGKPLSVAFTSAVAKPAILDEPVNNPDEVVVSTLGRSALIYCGMPQCQAGLKDQPLQPVPSSGLTLENIAANSELVVTDGKSPRNFTIESSTAPVLAVYLASNDNTGTLHITANVDDAQVTLNGQVQKRGLKSGNWSRKLTPGTWVVRVTKDGYTDSGEQKVDIAKGDTRALNFDLKPAVVIARLAIEGATPGADVWIDGLHAGTTTPSGVFGGDVGPGVHDVELRKDGFETLTISKRNFAAGQTVRLTGNDVRMHAAAVLNFQVNPSNAQIAYRHGGDSQVHQAHNGAVTVPPGQYVVTVSAPKRETREETVEVESGKTVTISWTLAASKSAGGGAQTTEKPVTGAAVFESPDAWQEQNGWYFHKGPSYAWVKSTRGSFNVVIARKTGGIFGGGKIEWEIGRKDDRNRVVYQLDEHKLLRRAFVNGNKADHNTNYTLKGDAYEFHIDIAPTRIVIRDAGGTVLDDYSDAKADFTAGKFGFKGDIRLVVR